MSPAWAVVARPAKRTVCFNEAIRRRGGTALILAHLDELPCQAADKIRTVAPELTIRIGFVQATRDDIGAPIVLAPVQTLARASRRNRLPREFTTVIVGEAHHATAKSYRPILDYIDAELSVGSPPRPSAPTATASTRAGTRSSTPDRCST